MTRHNCNSSCDHPPSYVTYFFMAAALILAFTYIINGQPDYTASQVCNFLGHESEGMSYMRANNIDIPKNSICCMDNNKDDFAKPIITCKEKKEK